MTEANTRPYHLRLTERFVDYDPVRGAHVWREFPKDKIVTDQTEIEFLESRGAPVERSR